MTSSPAAKMKSPLPPRPPLKRELSVQHPRGLNRSRPHQTLAVGCSNPVDAREKMGHSNVWNSHPKTYGPGSRTCRFFQIQGPIILNFTFPILFIAVVGCLYLHLGKKNISDITTSKRDTKLRFLKRPMIVKGVGIVTVTELTLFTLFIALCVWYFADYVRHWFKQAPMLAMTRHEQIRVCGNPHAIIRKYGLMCCRQCFRSNAKEIGFIKGDPDMVSTVSGRKEINYLDGWANSETLGPLNLMYGATPSDYISMIIIDYGMIPPTSVPRQGAAGCRRRVQQRWSLGFEEERATSRYCRCLDDFCIRNGSSDGSRRRLNNCNSVGEAMSLARQPVRDSGEAASLLNEFPFELKICDRGMTTWGVSWGLVRYHMNKLKKEFGVQIILDDVKVDESFEFAARENDCL
ncbi:hypothetical protein CASFOL_034456 [Castilleja foliolosa]|uniref:Uncharacterized protein n=1 Tax=Castilleja foliolosa TaxID=1961234 RepID=A0ABD3BXG5_9LAMI